MLALNSPWRSGKKKPSCFQVTPDLFHWQGHLLDGVRVTLSFGIGCLELASGTFVYVRFPYPEPGSAPQLEVKGWTLTPDCGSYFFFFLARCCLGQVPGGAPFSQGSEQATACTNRMQIRN